MAFSLNILGCSSATPTTWSNPSAQLLKMEEKHFLIDCGEGTQVQLRKKKIKFSRIDHIFISHLHGDHFFGLIGFLSTMHINDRKKELDIYSPKGLKEIIVTQLRITNTRLSYFINFHEISTKELTVILDDKKVTVSAIPLKHRIETYGYLFQERPKERKLNIDKIEELKIEVCDYRNLKLGKDYIADNGVKHLNSSLTFNPPKPLSYAYCSDTAYTERLIPWISEIDLLYHESTFLEDKKDLAKKTGHSTAKQAAAIAKKCNVGKLILGHFSARYKDRSLFLNEANEVFNRVVIASEELEINIPNSY